ncbi:hypothetical protein PTTG_26586 [Puccinia triticina 1-1 BBBD Race 1]|uniref:Uncharacterized protein n=1 Tax=Puccinia triticina (isolate 1-1 / race 1 (BBBD)) TaxID=630390 RepID=A0A180GSP0_PUCT1|nr:hypothetical protein PTTG_26586 [Puccinia triticina 1-1 BBBD Race 1]
MKKIFLCVLLLWPEVLVILVRLALPPTEKSVQEAVKEYGARNFNLNESPKLGLTLGGPGTSLDEQLCRSEPRAKGQNIEVSGESQPKKRPLSPNQERHLVAASSSNSHPTKKLRGKANQITRHVDFEQEHHNWDTPHVLDIDSLPPRNSLGFEIQWSKPLEPASVPTEFMLPSPLLEPSIHLASTERTENVIERLHSGTPAPLNDGITLNLFPERGNENRAEISRSDQLNSQGKICSASEAGTSRETESDWKVAELHLENEEFLWALLYSAKLAISDSLYQELMANHQGKIRCKHCKIRP